MFSVGKSIESESNKIGSRINKRCHDGRFYPNNIEFLFMSPIQKVAIEDL